MSSNEWKECKLGDVCLLGDGAHTKVKRVESGLPYLTSKNIKSGYINLENVDYICEEDYYKLFGESQKSVRHLQEGDVLIGIIGTLGNCYLYKKNDRFGISSSIGIIRPNKKIIYPKYLYHMINSKRFLRFIQSFKGGSVQAYTNLPTLRNVPISLPPIEDQIAIAHILTTLDEKIETNNQINRKLEEMAQAIYKQWFVDFEFSNENGEPYKSSGGEMVESEVGIIPKGFILDEIGNISEIQNGFAFKAPEYVENGVKVLRTLNIDNNGYFQNDNLVYLPNEYRSEKYEKYFFEKFDIALVMVGASIGKIGLVLENTNKSLQNQNMWRFRSISERIPQQYLYYLVKEAQKISFNWSTGSAREFYRKDSFSKIKVVIPDEKILIKFNKIINPIFDKISCTNNEIEKLTNIRDTILPKLMSGEIRVPINKVGELS